MRICRVARPDGPAFGVVHGDHVALLDGHPFGRFRVTDQVAFVGKVRMLAPVLPSKVLCVGRNYADHAAEMGGDVPAEPLIFSKPATAVVGPEEAIRLPELSQEVHHEAELAVVIGRLTRKVGPRDALDAVLGYTIANDVTARDLQRRDGQWTRAKGFDTFCPLGPWIVTPDEVPDPHDLRMELWVNGELRQESHSSRMAVTIPEILSQYSAVGYSAGDIVSTGTVSGVAAFSEDPHAWYLRPGDVMECRVEHLGVLRNPVISWQEAYGRPAPPKVQW